MKLRVVLPIIMVTGFFLTTPVVASTVWSYSFTSVEALNDWDVKGSFEINKDCTLHPKETEHYGMWVNNTGSTGSWMYSVKLNSEKDTVAFYPAVVDTETTDSGIPNVGFFFGINVYNSDNRSYHTYLELMSKNLTQNSLDIHHVGLREINYTLNGWQNILITRNSSYFWEVYINKTLFISYSLGNVTLGDDYHGYQAL